MRAAVILEEIFEYCRKAGMAESTFGRRAVNDGKFVNRLRYGGKVNDETAERVRAFMAGSPLAAKDRAAGAAKPHLIELPREAAGQARPESEPEKNFRFYDNRQKYLMFVNTCSEKWVVAQRVALELANLHAHPPGIRLFDAGVGDGTVLTRVMRSLHRRFPWVPFYVVGKEISLEDVRLSMEKMPDRFQEHPATCLVMTNMNYAEAPWLKPNSVVAATSMVWKEVALRGNTAAEFDEQIAEIQPFLAEHWGAAVSKKSGNPVYEKPVVLVVYREDCRFLLDHIMPKRGAVQADYDLVIASQPYRARASTAFKAKRVIAPLTRALAPGGRLFGIHSCGADPALEIVQAVWPGEDPFQTNRHDLLKATKTELGSDARYYNFSSYSDERSLFQYEMHTLPGEIDAENSSIGTSTLFAAWNNATYVAQVEDERLADAMKTGSYLETTREVLKRYGRLWFNDESFVISRKRDR
jgi:hypothetical protein